MNCHLHPEEKTHCPICAGLDLYKPQIFPCTAGEMRRKLCLDGHDCWCLKSTKEGAWEADGKVSEAGMARYWLEKFLESQRALNELKESRNES